MSDHSLIPGPQNRKRQRAEETSESDIEPPAQRTKTRSELEVEAWWNWEYPPEFWDRLSRIILCRAALKELDRRTGTQHSFPPAADPITPTFRELARFARRGGPDLRHLRGYVQESKSTDPASTLLTAEMPGAKTKGEKETMDKTGPYSPNFDMHLTDHAIYPVARSRKPDLEEIRARLVARRPSLSPSMFSEAAFEAFQDSDDQAKDEADVKADVIPTILGTRRANHHRARSTVFTNLEPLTDGTASAPKPDIYYGAYPEQLVRPARNELASHIVPSTTAHKPMAPNFFLEVKGPDGKGSVARRQACYDGAAGCRAMHSLQNYGAEEPEYDGKAYTFSSTYHEGTLKLYAHHVTAPTTEGGRPEYHMTQVRSFALTDDFDTFVKGATALRNMLDFADEHRTNFILAANENERASRPETVASRERTMAELQPLEDDSADELAL